MFKPPTSAAAPSRCRSWLSLKSAYYMPAEEFDDGRHSDMASAIQLIAWADAIEENIPCEPLRARNRDSRRSSDRVPIAHLAFDRKPAGKLVVQEQRRLDAVMVRAQTLRSVARREKALELEREVCAFRRNCSEFESRLSRR